MQRQPLDALLVSAALEHPLHVDPGGVNQVGIERAGGHQLLHLGDRGARRGGHHGGEVAGGPAVHQVPQRVRLPGLDEGEVGPEPGFQDVGPAVEPAHLLALGDQRSVAGGGEEGGDSGPARAHAFGEGALRVELHLQLAAQGHLLEDLVLAHVGRDHLLHLPVLEQEGDPEVVGPGVVADQGEVAAALVTQGQDQVLGEAAEAEARDHDRRSVGDVLDRLGGVLHDLLHGETPGAPCASADR
jgi:hypothetical protein